MAKKTPLRIVTTLAIGLGLAINASPQSFLTNGLVAYYPFNGNALDASANHNNGNPTNVFYTKDRFGQTNSAADFSVGKAVVECPTLFSLAYYPVTYSVWFDLYSYVARAESPGGSTMTLVGRDQGGVNGGGALSVYSETAVSVSNELYYYTGGAVRSHQTAPTNRWTHLVFTFDSSRLTTFYLDGKPVHSEVFTAVQGAAIPFRIGAAWDWVAGSGRFSWRGALDDVRIYNRALSSNEVAQLYGLESGPNVHLIKQVKPAFSSLYLGSNYQMQLSSDMTTWTNYGSPFNATNSTMVYPESFDLENWGNLFFRLH